MTPDSESGIRTEAARHSLSDMKQCPDPAGVIAAPAGFNARGEPVNKAKA